MPETDHGEEISAGFRGLAEQGAGRVRPGPGHHRRAGHRGRPRPSTTGSRAAVETLNKEYDASALDTGKLSSDELKQAFDEVPECR